MLWYQSTYPITRTYHCLIHKDCEDPMTNCKVSNLAKTFYQKALGRGDNESAATESKGEATRERILEAAFDEIYEHGFQGMRIENVLQKTQLAKGALYHHFPSKKSLGYAVVDEVLFACKKEMLSVLEHTNQPIDSMRDLLSHVCDEVTEEELARGCPVNNLTQEMAGLDEGFHERLTNIYCYWQTTMADALKRGQAQGNVRADINPEIVATFIISSVQGITGTIKCMPSVELMGQLYATLSDYLLSLKSDNERT